MDSSYKKPKPPIIRHYIILLLTIVSFFILLSFLVYSSSFSLLLGMGESFFRETNISTTLSYFNNFSNDQITFNGNFSITNSTFGPSIGSANGSLIDSEGGSSFGLNTISSIIGILGFLGIIGYLFYSIKEGTLGNSENQRLRFGFACVIFIVLLALLITFYSILLGHFPNKKIYELIGIWSILLFTAIISAKFIRVYEIIDEDYKNRLDLLEFLEIADSNPITLQPIDNICRFLILNHEFISFFVFLSILLIPVFGFLKGLNLLSVIFLEVCVFLLFNGFYRLISLCGNTSNITLKSRLNNTEFSFAAKKIYNVFFLQSNEKDFFKILTEKGYTTISKNEVISIHDNEVLIFKGKEKLQPMHIWVKRLLRSCISLILTMILSFVLFFISVYVVKNINPQIITQITPEAMQHVIIAIVGISAIFAFCFVGYFSHKIDDYIKRAIDQKMTPQPFDYPFNQ